MWRIKVIGLIVLATIFGCRENENHGEKVVELRLEDGSYQLYRNGEPYYIRGGGGTEHFDELARIGGNSVRTWSTHEAGRILDEAHKHGLTVTLGIEIGKAAWGEDFNYLNFRAVNQKVEEIKELVEKYKDHPALLIWGVGNEVHLHGGNRILVCYMINKIAKMIHEVDPNHPVMTTTTAGKHLGKYGFMRILCPYVDILGINAFERLPDVADDMRSPTGWGKAYIVSEFGSIGHWEVRDTEWGAHKELSTTEKAQTTADFWEIVSSDREMGLGGYAFYWGHKYEITHTWFSLFSEEGYRSESFNILESQWLDSDRVNFAPKIYGLSIQPQDREDNIYLESGQQYFATVVADDPEDDPLNYKWEIRHDGITEHIPGRFVYNYNHLFESEPDAEIRFSAPEEEGTYRLFVFVHDDKGNFASHNLPFYVLLR
ncbi:glycoside hydrolase family 2 TIM barrel-domain containing protein [Pleomorphovibrio marinus]|uniref:glycoside hydrolase family 2 TIM barrel-domain containing protein n=1 Tax=Pleomorphovibrio marinus TaxID=2164132 RepID=UPI000E0C894B|nr:glycoside hydrolase family 2 TIM barrel-domain containing protein [Pleomorphovibrio marinus]